MPITSKPYYTMNNDFTNTELLNRYLDKELDEPDMEQVEKRLRDETSLKIELERLKLAREAVRLYGLKEKVHSIRADMKKNEQKNVKSQKGIVRNLTRWSMRVAAILILLVAGMGAYEYITLSSKKMYDQLYAPYELRSTRAQENLSPLESAFSKKDYANTITIFLYTEQHSTADYFFTGISYMEFNEPREAIPYFQAALKDSSGLYKDELEYYLALSYLYTHRIKEAKPLFEKIHSDPNHLFHDKVNNWFLMKLSLVRK